MAQIKAIERTIRVTVVDSVNETVSLCVRDAVSGMVQLYTVEAVEIYAVVNKALAST